MPKTVIAGVDEAGRGPLAGPVVAAAVILSDELSIHGLTDSKLLTHKKRMDLAEIIKEKSIAYAVSVIPEEKIDEINIHHASLLAMDQALAQLAVKPTKALIDGKFCPKSSLAMEAIVGGDKLIPQISAASIIAKTYRDQLMLKYDKIYPEYGFAQHKGYPTKNHLAALQQYGVCPIHRKSYAPVKRCLQERC